MNLKGLMGAYQHNGEKGITVRDICKNMNDITKMGYILDDIAISCKLQNTPKEIMEYHVCYTEVDFDTLYVQIEKRKEKS